METINQSLWDFVTENNLVAKLSEDNYIYQTLTITIFGDNTTKVTPDVLVDPNKNLFIGVISKFGKNKYSFAIYHNSTGVNIRGINNVSEEQIIKRTIGQLKKLVEGGENL